MNKICFNGCSFTVGEGFPAKSRNKFIYDRIVCRELNSERKNIANGGSSNLLIFQRSLYEIMHGDSDIVFNQWSGLNRLWLSPGPEVWFFTNDKKHKTFSYRDLYFNEKELMKLKNNLLLMNHDYQNIIDLCLYVETLNNLGKLYNKKIYHINGLLPWQNDLITIYDPKDLYNSLDSYTKEILDFDSRDDSEIIYFFEKLRNTVKSVDTTKWVNIFDSWRANITDAGPEGHHPGIQSHQWMADKVINFLENKI